MVLSFFKGGSGDGDFEHIVTKSVAMLGDARHSFDLATLALLTDADPEALAQDIRDTDERINATEQELRSELVVHVAVKGAADIGSVLGFTLLLKKIERVGDQAKNILDLAEHGVTLADRADTATLLEERQVLSALFAEAGELLGTADPDSADIDDYADRVNAITADYQSRINRYLTSDEPAREIVPLAIYHRFLRRIAANLLGVVRTSAEPVSPDPASPPAEDDTED